MRTFLAIDLPDPVRAALVQVQDALKPEANAVSWTRRENLHLTLRFLGNVDVPMHVALTATLEDTLREAQPPLLTVAGLGAFPSMARPRVLYAGITCLSGALDSLQRLAENAAQHAGLPPEASPFHPHLTLGRVRYHARNKALTHALHHTAIPPTDAFVADAVSLYESVLGPAGPVYTRRKRLRIGCW